MRYSKSKYPVGARWEATNSKGIKGSIELRRRDKFEMWVYNVTHSDGGSRLGWTDWYFSKELARKHIPEFYKGERFKRVK